VAEKKKSGAAARREDPADEEKGLVEIKRGRLRKGGGDSFLGVSWYARGSLPRNVQKFGKKGVARRIGRNSGKRDNVS